MCVVLFLQLKIFDLFLISGSLQKLVLLFDLIVTCCDIQSICGACLGVSNGYIKNDHEEAFYRTPENVGNW